MNKGEGSVKPIIFNSEMVRAILDGRKTVTRRVVKPQPEKSAHSPYECCGGRFAFRVGELGCTDQYRPPYRPGEIVYVRETWTVWNGSYEYKADVDDGYGPFCTSCIENICMGGCNDILKWRPSIHMPKEAARIFLRVTDVRVERLQDMNMADVKAEGVVPNSVKGGQWQHWQHDYMKPVWDITIKPADRSIYGWDANPFVWVINFKQTTKEEAYGKDDLK